MENVNIIYIITKNNEIIFIQNYLQNDIFEARENLKNQFEEINDNENIKNLVYNEGKKIEFDSEEEHHKIEIIESK